MKGTHMETEKPVPLDEDGLMNGKTCQKHNMTEEKQKQTYFAIPIHASSSRFLFTAMVDVLVCDKDEIHPSNTNKL